jgi:mRNA interferase RelE/StbE
MNYRIVVTTTAAMERRRLDSKIQERLDTILRSLGETPLPRGAKKLTGSEQDWRIGVGDYRILYEIDSELKQVTVWRISHRREAYR